VRVLLTGATGFIGSRVARVLIANGHDVRALIRSNSNLRRIADVSSDLDLFKADLLDVESVERAVADFRPQLVIHLAWYAEPGEYLHSAKNLEMLTASTSLARAASKAACERFVGVGTCFEYELGAEPLDEAATIQPGSLYAASKVAFSEALSQLEADEGMQSAWARLFYQYGPYEDGRRLVPSIISAVLNGDEAKTTKGEQVRDYLHVDDVASAITSIAASHLTGPVNVGSGTAVTVAEVAKTIADAVGGPELLKLGAVPYREGDPMVVVADTTLLNKGTGWSPKFDLRSGIEQTVEWWKAKIEDRMALPV